MLCTHWQFTTNHSHHWTRTQAIKICVRHTQSTHSNNELALQYYMLVNMLQWVLVGHTSAVWCVVWDTRHHLATMHSCTVFGQTKSPWIMATFSLSSVYLFSRKIVQTTHSTQHSTDTAALVVQHESGARCSVCVCVLLQKHAFLRF